MLELGQIFPPKEEQERIKLQTNWEKMLHGTYIYNKIIDQTGKHKNVDPLVPIPAALAEISSDLLFGEFPNIDFQDKTQNKTVQEYFKNKRFETDMLELTAYKSALGMMFWKLGKIAGKTHYEFVKPNMTLWTEDVYGLNNVKFFVEIEKSQVRKEVSYQIQEHFYENTKEPTSTDFDPIKDRRYRIIEYVIIVNTTDGKIKKIEMLDEETPSINFIPIIKDENLGQIGSLLGKSDYQGKEQLFAEIDNRVDQINWVLQENADPWKAIPAGILDQHGRFSRTNGKMFQKGAGGTDSTVDIMTWDASLAAAFQQIDKMIEMVFFTSRISSPIAGLEKGGQVESGRALKWRSINTFSMINRKRKYAELAIKKFFMMLKEMDEDLNDIDVENMIINWQDGLPMDETEKVTNIVQQVSANLLSHLTGIKKINEVDDKTAQDEMDIIQKEQKEAADIKAAEIPITL